MSRATTASLNRRQLLSGAAAVAVAAATPIMFGAPAAAGADGGDCVLSWSLTALDAIKMDNGYKDPLQASRILAMMHIAIHDAANAAKPRFKTWMRHKPDDAADAWAAANAAAHGVLTTLLPGTNPDLDVHLGHLMFGANGRTGVQRGLDLGARVAATIVAARENDGWNLDVPYTESGKPGRYRFVPGTDFVARPGWRNLKPFALTSPAQFRAAPPPALDSADYARALAEVRDIGERNSGLRSADQTQAALFWHEFSDITWNRVGRVVAAQRYLDLHDSARMFALLNMALADGYIAGWDSKLHYDFWRPVTAIAASGEAPGWTPLLTTPPVQDHPSTHSALGAAATIVLADAVGNTDFAFELTTTTARPASTTRAFRNFRAAALENAESRVLGGIHFRFACEAGLKLGEQVGREVLMTQLADLTGGKRELPG